MRCRYCGEPLTVERFLGADYYVDATGGDVCSGDDDLNNENQPHRPEDQGAA